MPTRMDYTEEAVNAARSVLLEAFCILEAYRSELVVVGSWVPALLIGGHRGTLDVDLGLDPALLQRPGYPALRKQLCAHGYEADPVQSHRFYRMIRSVEEPIPLDFITTERAYRSYREEHPKDGPGHARGLELALAYYAEITLEGVLPDGSATSQQVRVAELVPYLVMKAAAFADRTAAKDAYDICFCAQHGPDTDTFVRLFQPYRSEPAVQEMLRILEEKFASPDAIGPRCIADFDAVTHPEERARLQQAAFGHVDRLLQALKVSWAEPPAAPEPGV